MVIPGQIDRSDKTLGEKAPLTPKRRFTIDTAVSDHGINFLGLQVGLDVTSSSLDIGQSIGVAWEIDDFVSNVVNQDIVVLRKGINGPDVFVQKRGCP